jgi:ATP synthase protein I
LFEGWTVSVSQQQTSKPIYKVVALQAILVLVTALAATFLFDGLKGLSAAVGGAIAVTGSLMYALLVAGKSGDAASVLKAHFVAEMVKVFITVVLFALALLLFHSASMLWLIAGFALATLAYWLALLIV